MSRHNRPCLLRKVTTRVKVKPAIFGLGAHAHKPPPEVKGLEKPPAGSRRGGGGGSVPCWKETDRGRGQLLHTGELQSKSCATCGRSPAAPRVSAPLLGGGASSQTTLRQHPIPTGCGLDLKLTWSPENMKWGEPNTQQKTTRINRTSATRSKRASDPHSQGPIPPTPLPQPPRPHSWCSCHFAANDLQMCAHLAASPPPLSKETKERGEENDKSRLCVTWQAQAEATEAPFPVQTSLRRRQEAVRTPEPLRRFRDRAALFVS